MKKILIVGKDSYIGTHFKSWMEKQADDYQVDELSVLDDGWKEFSFEGYDSILHVAGIVHVSSGPTPESLYYCVNCDLAVEVASKAKKDRVRHFVFMSSKSVYGADNGSGMSNIISPQVIPAPENFYGKSKLMAEEKLCELEDESFSVAKIRPPMVYGPGCKGNFPKLLKLAKNVRFFPDIENQRSMIYIDNLCEFLRIVIQHRYTGIFFPQNAEYVCTKEIIVATREILGKRTYLVSLFNPLIRAISSKVQLVQKVFGSKVYEHEMSNIGENYQVVGFEKSIELSVQTTASGSHRIGAG